MPLVRSGRTITPLMNGKRRMWVGPPWSTPWVSRGVEKIAREIGKDGLTVKKLIALLLVVAFVCAGTVGCGETKTTTSGPAGGPPKTGATEKTK